LFSLISDIDETNTPSSFSSVPLTSFFEIFSIFKISGFSFSGKSNLTLGLLLDSIFDFEISSILCLASSSSFSNSLIFSASLLTTTFRFSDAFSFEDFFIFLVLFFHSIL